MIGRLASVNMDLLLPSKEQLQVKQQLQGTTGTAKPVMTQPKSLADALMEKKVWLAFFLYLFIGTNGDPLFIDRQSPRPLTL